MALKRIALPFKWFAGFLAAGPTFVATTACVAAFAVMAILTPFLPLYTFYRTVLLAAEIGILIYFLPATYDAMKARHLTAGDRMALGLWVGFLGDLALGGWALAQKVIGADWMLFSQFLTFIIFVKAAGAMLVLTSPNAVDPISTRRSWLIFSGAFVCGCLFSGLVLWLAAEA